MLAGGQRGPAAPEPRAVTSALAALGPDAPSVTRRDVVRAWAGALPAGAPAAEVARVVDGFLAHVGAASGDDRGRRRDGPGVAETRHRLPDELRRTVTARGMERREDRRQVEQLLARRGMAVDAERSRSRALELGAGLGW